MEFQKQNVGSAMMGKVARLSWSPLLLLVTVLVLLSIQITTQNFYPIGLLSRSSSQPGLSGDVRSCVGFLGELSPRREVVMSIKDFGGVGDGKTSNTETFRE